MKIYRMEWKSPYGEPENLTRKQLIEFCKKNGIKKYSRKRNSQIVELIKEAKDEKIRLCAEAAAAAEKKKKKEDRERRSEKSFYFPNRAWANIISFCNGMLKYKEINSRQEFLEIYWRIYQSKLYNGLVKYPEILKGELIPYLRNIKIEKESIISWMRERRHCLLFILHKIYKPCIYYNFSHKQEPVYKTFADCPDFKLLIRHTHTYTCNCCQTSTKIKGRYSKPDIKDIQHTDNCNLNIILDIMLNCYKMRDTYVVPDRYLFNNSREHPEITDKRIYKLIVEKFKEWKLDS